MKRKIAALVCSIDNRKGAAMASPPLDLGGIAPQGAAQ
jgi:hypothetical protein